MTQLETANLNTQLHLYSGYKQAIEMAQSTQQCEVDKVLRILTNPTSKDSTKSECSYTNEQVHAMVKLLNDLLEPPTNSYLEKYLNTAKDRSDLIHRLNV